jgi:hypothetical protein
VFQEKQLTERIAKMLYSCAWDETENNNNSRFNNNNNLFLWEK